MNYFVRVEPVETRDDLIIIVGNDGQHEYVFKEDFIALTDSEHAHVRELIRKMREAEKN